MGAISVEPALVSGNNYTGLKKVLDITVRSSS
jgi:hypothetical protein